MKKLLTLALFLSLGTLSFAQLAPHTNYWTGTSNVAPLGSIAYSNGNASWSTLGIGSEGQCLLISSGLPAYGACGAGTVTSVALSLPSFFNVSGSPVTTSGTLTATVSTTTGDLLYAASNGAITSLPIGTTGQVLTVAGGAPTWADSSAGGITSINGDTTAAQTIAAGSGISVATSSGTTTITATGGGGGGVSTTTTSNFTPGAVGSTASMAVSAVSGIFFKGGPISFSYIGGGPCGGSGCTFVGQVTAISGLNLTVYTISTNGPPPSPLTSGSTVYASSSNTYGNQGGGNSITLPGGIYMPSVSTHQVFPYAPTSISCAVSPGGTTCSTTFTVLTLANACTANVNAASPPSGFVSEVDTSVSGTTETITYTSSAAWTAGGTVSFNVVCL